MQGDERLGRGGESLDLKIISSKRTKRSYLCEAYRLSKFNTHRTCPILVVAVIRLNSTTSSGR